MWYERALASPELCGLLEPQLPGLSAEQQDVHSFLLRNVSNGGILDLMMHYLKAVGQTFLKEWPKGLAAVVLEVYQTWRKYSGGLPNPLLRDCSTQHIRVMAVLLLCQLHWHEELITLKCEEKLSVGRHCRCFPVSNQRGM